MVTFPSTGIFAGEGAFLNLSGEKQGRMVVASPVGQYVPWRRMASALIPAP